MLETNSLTTSTIPVVANGTSNACLANGARVTELEAGRLEEARPEREAFLRQLRSDIEQQARERGVEVHFPDHGSPVADGPHQRS